MAFSAVLRLCFGLLWPKAGCACVESLKLQIPTKNISFSHKSRMLNSRRKVTVKGKRPEESKTQSTGRTRCELYL